MHSIKNGELASENKVDLKTEPKNDYKPETKPDLKCEVKNEFKHDYKMDKNGLIDEQNILAMESY
jgi:hypothetical protein